ncbi:tRNA (adenosine(37)-N6)-threonylcarbamoyltransferase complex dimerization subunit type 1 TsaB [Candidatus Thiodiazotropha sp. CDECU1]|uniref:tRNA (adenosine(37)-N6)-threonylcarbamoyltransferase complex dimerization subunit type 1 TsaB n=1 Tax=Candidatus Thiodiazotropha sp. CDECU1 TaxID=3065865 RepID=UPI002930A210|nr:tRNA (adenosine(37)-N6)-threonylcarbamoyltransferase complex dimerization subunit type 1 TsaB [Candidatus Thiodiazotropha sp. CDECU1]
MKLIAIETAAEACSAALYLSGDISIRYKILPRGHSELILEMVDDLLREANLTPASLDAVAFGRGPGSFTGVRIATGVIQGIAFAADLPVVGVSTLAALAQRAYREKGERKLLTAFDARMGELYWAGYRVGEKELAVPAIPEQVGSPQQVEIPHDDEWYGVGSGWGAYSEQLEQRLRGTLLGFKAEIYCSARDIASLAAADYQAGLAVAPEHALPVYLRNQVANKL